MPKCFDPGSQLVSSIYCQSGSMWFSPGRLEAELELKMKKDFFEDVELLEIVRKSGVKISVGFDGHKIEDYDGERIRTACERLEKLSIPLIKL